MNPLISVIVPVYNTSAYLSKCLDSILNQTLKDIEIIVVNDGSKDNSQQIIDDYSIKDNRIKSIMKENGGLSDARNVGIENATGEFIAFIDSDDYIDCFMFEKMINMSEKHHSEIVLCDLVKVDENGNEFRDLPQSPQLPEKIVLKDDFSLFGEMSCFACNKIFRKELFVQHCFRVGIHFEDIELIPKLVLDSTIISKINEPFYKYFERQDSITKTHTEKGLDMFLAINEVTNYFYKSKYNTFVSELKRFQIIQGYYSYLAYVAYVKNKLIKRQLLDELNNFLKMYKLSKKDIKEYKRFDQNYLNSLPLKKRIYYHLSLINLQLLLKF
ncbi:glycosyltransferase family 2 protein [Empedobacter brevis]|uniref:glycosyltransferase family 2 protein n=1 Tax=Empedobacter brevis TaxID=247 RepID=UPI0039B0E2C8